VICLSTTANSVDGALEQLRRHAGEIDMLELRADFFAAVQDGRGADDSTATGTFHRFADEARRLWAAQRPEHGRLEIILTIRREHDGGRYRGDERKRMRILERAVSTGHYDYLDLEEDLLETEDELAVVGAAADAGVTVIRSFHAPKGAPADLCERARRTASRAHEVPKLAVYARGSAELLSVLKVGRELGRRKRIVIAMGPYGVAVRVLARVLGSFLSYCSAADSEHAAPGHLSPTELYRMYRYHELSEHTAVYAVIGDPVMHSRSPQFHNAVFGDRRLSAVYLPLQIDDLSVFPEISRHLGLQGVSVTIPHKGAIRKVLSDCEPAVDAVAACNTALRRRDGSWYGYNTDLEAFLAPLTPVFGREADGGPRLAGVRCTVIGAGGAARAVVYGLLARGAQILILNRSPERAEALAAELAASLGVPAPRTAALQPSARELPAAYRELLVQTTSVGMEPHSEGDPLSFYEFTGAEVAYDIVYTPPETVWLQRARRAGCRVIGGRAMFEAQARAQSRLFLAQLAGEELPARTPPVG